MKLIKTDKAKHKVMIADQNLLFRRGLRALVAPEPDVDVIDEAASCQEMLAKIGGVSAEVLVIDVDLMKDCERVGAPLRQSRPDLLILCIVPDEQASSLPTSHSKAEADDYLLKSCARAELLQRIRQISAPDEAAEKQSSDLHALATSNLAGSRGDVLTQREKEVLSFLAEGFTVREVAGELGLSGKTAEAHTLNLMRKLDIHDRASLIEYAHSAGVVTVRPKPIPSRLSA